MRIPILVAALALSALPAHGQALHDYRRADSVAAAVPAEATVSPRALGEHIRAALPGERDRARAVFRWIAANVEYDARAYRSANPLRVPHQQPAAVLARRRAVCEGFAALVLAVTAAAGLEAVPVIGSVKAYSPSPRRPYRVQTHVWNAVRVDGRWLLLDAGWAAGDLVEGRFVRRVRDFYFDTPPERLIWSHRARDPAWQLLDRPVSDREFRRLPFTQRDFWEMDFDAARVREAAALRGFPGFVGVFPHPDRPVRVVDAPLALRLPPGVPQPFRIRAPGASEVTVVSGGVWTPLEGEGEAFSGEAAMAGSDLVVMVRYPDLPEGVVVMRYQTEGARGR